MIPSDFDSLKELNSWFKSLDKAGKKEHGRAFNERKTMLAAAKPPPPALTFQRPKSKYLRKIMSLWCRPSHEWTQEDWNWLHDAAHCHVCGRPLYPLCACWRNDYVIPVFIESSKCMMMWRAELKDNHQ